MHRPSKPRKKDKYHDDRYLDLFEFVSKEELSNIYNINTYLQLKRNLTSVKCYKIDERKTDGKITQNRKEKNGIVRGFDDTSALSV